MSNSGSQLNYSEVYEAIDRALHGLELETDETNKLISFANNEVHHLQTPEPSYLILGSYRDPFIRRLRMAVDQLNKRHNIYPVVIGDVNEIDISRLPVFRIKFHILATFADYVVAVFEQDAGGEITELGKISETPYFKKSYVLPRDYRWMTNENIETKEEVLAAAINITYSRDLDNSEIQDEISSLAEQAQQSGISINIDEIESAIDAREDAEDEAVDYSWVHLNDFRMFELHGKCFPWASEQNLRCAIENVP